MTNETQDYKGPKLKVKVTNTVCGRVDIHEGLTKTDIEWIKSNPNLLVEVVEVRTGRRKTKK